MPLISRLNISFKKNYLFIILIILSFIVHFFHLSYPSEVMFDEVHFGKFVSAYFTGQYYFDIHPPLGKLLIAGWSKLTGYIPAFGFNYTGESFGSDLFFTLRFLPALFGSLFTALFAYFVYLISRSRKTALIAGFLILLDNALLVQSRVIGIDIFLIFFEILTLCFFFLYQKEKSFSFKWFAYLILTAVNLGLTISIKWTGLAVLGMIVAIQIAKIYDHRLALWLSPSNYNQTAEPGKNNGNSFKKLKIKEFLIGYSYILFISILVYTIPFMIHFKILTKSVSGKIFIPYSFEEKLSFSANDKKDPANYPNNSLLKRGFGMAFVELNLAMFGANAGIAKDHHYASRWYEWPIGKKPIYYWYRNPPDERSEKIEKIYLIGNLALWWTAAAAMLLTLFKIFISKKRLKPVFYILILGYAANIIPFIFIERSTFLYHYMPALMFAIALASFYLRNLWQNKKIIFVLILTFIIVGFLITLPFSYGWPISPHYNEIMMKIINFYN